MIFDGVADQVRRRMSRIRKTGSKPEVLVRQVAHRLGYRFRINRRDLPGTPDIVFPKRRKIILIHGCFWHQHPGCRHATQPRTRSEYWHPKLARNRARDVTTLTKLQALGWDVLVMWECELKDLVAIERALRAFLGGMR